jgi:hypothetical protein
LRRIKHWCELAAHMLIIGSALMRYKAMHAPNRKSSYWAATISAYMISLAAVPLFVRAFAAFDWIKVGGDGGLARTFKIADHVLHRISWMLIVTGILIAGLSLTLATLQGDDMTVIKAMYMVLRGLML